VEECKPLTRGAIAAAQQSLDDLLPALRQKLIDGGKGGGGSGGKAGKGGGLQLIPKLSYITVAQARSSNHSP
jgi:hypothetical protein